MHWTEEVHRSALVDFLAALVDGIEKDETEAVQAILRSHTMEANERSIWIKSDLEFLDAHELWLTLLGVFTEVSLFFSLIKDHIADTVIIARQNADSVRLVVLAELPHLLILIHF